MHFLRLHAVSAVEEACGQHYRRTMRLPHGSGVLSLSPDEGGRPGVRCSLRLADLRDVGVAVERCRRLADLDADPMAVREVLAGETELTDDLARHPGLRVPGHPDGFELAIRAVLGQQVSLASARSLTARLIRDHGEPLPAGPDGELTHLFPTPDALAAADPDRLAGPKTRGRTLVSLAAAVATGAVVLDRGGDRAEVTASLLALPGIGPWTAGYVAMRALGDPDVVLDGDVGLHAALSLRGPTARTALRSRAARWRPWGSYACLYLWHRVLDARWPDSAPLTPLATGAAS
jgi:AraC family transcriptional regulator of adaptative response / DNA-3-methyladenine glycosylase II